MQADADVYRPVGTFDVIVFNESLYYMHDPLGVVERYRLALKQDGIVIVSTYEGSRRASAILRALKERYPVVDEMAITQHVNRWRCTVFRAD